MASQMEPPLCHLLRLPYELLKPILANLSKQDQISTAKTCVTLWELAYPMAYNRITVTIRPGFKDAAWQHLTSSVGLRYVQHLKISSLCVDTEKGRKLGNLVTGTLIAALRRNQLLSFISTPPVMWKGNISMKHVISLLETQGRLQTLSLSGLELEPLSSVRLRDYFQPSQVLSHIHGLTFNVSYDQTYDEEIYEIVKKSPNFRDLHIRFSQDAVDTVPQVYPENLNASLSRQRLHSMVTRLTLQRTVFWGSQNDLCFPALRALAVIDCSSNDQGLFFTRMCRRSTLPQLTALMVKTQNDVSSDIILEFIRGLSGLREFIVHGANARFDDGADIAYHGKTLELLSLHCLEDRLCFSSIAYEAGGILKALHALRHLSLFVPEVMRDYPGKSLSNDYSNYGTCLDVIAGYTNLQTLGLRSVITLTRTPQNYENQRLAQIDHGAICEEALGRDVITRISSSPTYQNTKGLDYLVTEAKCRLFPEYQLRHQTIDHIQNLDFKKRMFALKPKLAFREASRMREQMLDRYSKDGYYFLEDYIDGLMEKSEVCFKASL